MIQTDELLPLLRRKIAGPLDITMCESLQSAAVIFCRESTICRQSITMNDVPEYEQQKLSSGSEHLNIVKVLGVTGMERDRDFTGGHNSVTFMTPVRHASVLCVLAPKLNGSMIPEVLSQYAQSLCHGALADLYTMAGKAWYSPDLSAWHQQRFTDGYRAAWQQTMNSSPVSGYSNPTLKTAYY